MQSAIPQLLAEASGQGPDPRKAYPRKNSGMTPQPFSWPARVYWEDTDAGGVVYHTNYVKFMERARTEWLRAKGVEQSVLQREGLVFAVYGMQVQFVKPARLDDALAISVELKNCRRASFSVRQRILNPGTGVELCRGEFEIACLDAARFRPCPIPTALLTEIQR